MTRQYAFLLLIYTVGMSLCAAGCAKTQTAAGTLAEGAYHQFESYF